MLKFELQEGCYMNYVGSHIRPLSDLRNNFADITRTVEETRQPVILTKHGRGKLVCMSYEDYEKQLFKREIFDKLQEAEREAASGAKRLTVSEAFDSLILELEAMPGGSSGEI
jgi:prevent-host-death family protein